jgi:hypothetical protein
MTQTTPGTPSGGVPPKLQGKTVALAGEAQGSCLERVAALVRAEGGKVVPRLTKSLDYLVLVGWWRAKQPRAAKEAERLNRQQRASIQILRDQDFYQLLTLTRDEAEALLRAGPEGVERWNRLPCRPALFDLTGIDLQGAWLR